MSLTIDEISDILKERVDPDLLIELLDLSTEDIVDRFPDVIEDRRHSLLEYIDDTEN